ncbi:gluconokinase [Maritalea sp.]|uniref:gluconokinase n=1 Tax=Maritalea sp. TaxID=2003361 RepID=UPI003EF892E8
MQGERKLIIIIGVSGTGKSTIAQKLAGATGGVYLDADDYHSPINVQTMRNGQPLNDSMRYGWLQDVCAAVSKQANPNCVLACSALKKQYRDVFRERHENVRFVLLDVPKQVLQSRLKNRKNHYMPPSLLDSQLATLQLPDAHETDVELVDGTLLIEQIVAVLNESNANRR